MITEPAATSTDMFAPAPRCVTARSLEMRTPSPATRPPSSCRTSRAGMLTCCCGAEVVVTAIAAPIGPAAIGPADCVRLALRLLEQPGPLARRAERVPAHVRAGNLADGVGFLPDPQRRPAL